MPQLKKGFPKFPLLGPPIRGDLVAQSGLTSWRKILEENPDRTGKTPLCGPPTPRGRGAQVPRDFRAFTISVQEFWQRSIWIDLCQRRRSGGSNFRRMLIMNVQFA